MAIAIINAIRDFLIIRNPKISNTAPRIIVNIILVRYVGIERKPTPKTIFVPPKKKVAQ
jgi:hypothetical protein